MIELSICLQATAVGLLIYVARVAWQLSRILDQHRMMWHDYATVHRLPLETRARP